MDYMCEFLSEEAITLHKEHFRILKLKYSVLEKSDSRIKSLSLKELQKARLPKDTKREAIELMRDIIYHEIYFASFGKPGVKSSFIRSKYPSESHFIYDVYSASMNIKGGFLLFYNDRGKLRVVDSKRDYSFDTPVLAIDMEEHAYFNDYRFDRERYLKSALYYLAVDKLENL